MTTASHADTALHLSPAQLALLRQLVSRHLPGVAVLAFGSRVKAWATGTAALKPYADLDLAIAGQPDAQHLAALREDLDESDLPWRVDLCLLNELPDHLRARITTAGCPLS